MKIQFYLRFYTRPGQSLAISGNSKALGNNDIRQAFPLSYLNHDFWKGEIEVDPDDAVKIQYRYIFFREDGTSVVEWDDEKRIDISKSGTDEIQVFDTWCDAASYENAFYTAPFQEVLLGRKPYKLQNKITQIIYSYF